MKLPSQKQRILNELEVAEGSWVSTNYFKTVMHLYECNARLSELKNEGYNIETSKFTDDYGFRSHRLVAEPKQEVLL